jgi:hypothetical protein
MAQQDLEGNRQDLEDMRRNFGTQQTAMEDRTRRGGGGKAGTSTEKQVPPKLGEKLS